MRKVIVYKATSPTGISYIGITGRGLNRRKAEHIASARKGSKLPFHKAIRKYNSDIIWTIVAEVESYDAAYELEKQEIAKSANGYNVTKGGEGTLGVKPWCTGLPMAGNVKKKIAKSKGIKPFHVFRLKDAAFVGIWETQSDCAQDLGLSHKKISLCLNNVVSQHKGMFFLYEDDLTTANFAAKLNYKKTYKNSHIAAFDQDSVCIGTWASVTECAAALKIPRFGISQVLHGKIKCSGGFTFKSVDDPFVIKVIAA